MGDTGEIPADTLLQPVYGDDPHPFAFLTQIFALSTTSYPDTMTLDEAMSQPDKEEFVKAMYKQLSDHIGRRHWKIASCCSPTQTSDPHGLVNEVEARPTWQYY